MTSSLINRYYLLPGIIAYRHNAHPTCGPDRLSSMGIVTAAVDQIKMKGSSLVPDRDVYINGHVTWVGASSMEITMEVTQVSPFFEITKGIM